MPVLPGQDPRLPQMILLWKRMAVAAESYKYLGYAEHREQASDFFDEATRIIGYSALGRQGRLIMDSRQLGVTLKALTSLTHIVKEVNMGFRHPYGHVVSYQCSLMHGVLERIVPTTPAAFTRYYDTFLSQNERLFKKALSEEGSMRDLMDRWLQKNHPELIGMPADWVWSAVGNSGS